MKGCNISLDSEIVGYTSIANNIFITKAKIGSYFSISNFVSIGIDKHNLIHTSTNSIL
jgi:hypothetical protein